VANLVHKGWSQAAIARHLQIPPATVSRDLAAMREFWREFPPSDFEKVRIEHLQK
jgi:predicted transcriptional regulator